MFLFYACDDVGSPGQAAPTPRRMADSDKAAPRALRLLFSGPAKQERAAGFTTALRSEAITVRPRLRMHRGAAGVYLPRRFLDVPLVLVSPTAVRQIVSTLRQFAHIRRVEIFVARKPLCDYAEECS